MKAFLLAAGQGTRLRPITDTVPKCLVPIRGVPMLQIWIAICRKAGIDEVMINLHSHADAVRNWIQGNANNLTVRLTEEPTLLGSAGTIWANRKWVASEPFFWILYADVLTNTNLSRIAEFHRSRRLSATMGVCQVSEPSRCGIACFDQQMIIREFAEKPAQPRSTWAFSGIMIGTAQLIERIPDRHPADLGYDVLPQLVGDMLAYPISDYLLDVGTLDNYRAAQHTWPGLVGD